MAKGSKRQKKFGPKPPKTTRLKDARFRGEEDLDDEIDAFHKQRDMIPLDINAEDVSDDEMEHPVFDFKLQSSYSSERLTLLLMESDDTDDSDDGNDEDGGNDEKDGSGNNDDSDEAVKRLTPFERKIARQAKFLKQRMGGVEDDIDDDEPEEERKTVWGRHKSLYFNADNTDFELQSSDEELQAEEDEALRMQREKAKSFSMKDFGLDVSDEDDSDLGEKEKSLKDASIEGKTSKGHADAVYDENVHEDYIKVKKDLNALSREEQMDIVYSSAPELVGLLSELNEALDHLKRVKHLLCRIKEKKSVTEGAMHYLEVKLRLLLAYCQAIGFYLLLKSEGHSVRDHPVIARLVEIKNLFEKVKQLDENIPSQIEATLNNDHPNALGKGVVKENVASKLQSDVTGVVSNGSEVAVVQVSGKVFENTIQKGQNDKLDLQSREMLKLRASLEEKLKQKGIYNNLKRNPDRDQSHGSKLVNKKLRILTDFDDEVAEPMVNGQIRLSKPAKLSQLFATKLNKPTKLVSGEDDLPSRDDIGERRRKHELRVLARAGAGIAEDDDVADEHVGAEINNMDVDHEGSGGSEESEDEFYKQARRQRASKLSNKAEMLTRVPMPSLQETEADGKRHITYQMEKNKGLTRSRKKLTKIPRKKYKVKHQKAVVRRKGQVRDIRKPTGPYGGEAFGINPNVSRSVRFKS